MLSDKDYEESFFGACSRVYGDRGIEEAPAAVISVFEYMKYHLERSRDAGKALQQLADSGSESAKFLLSEHKKTHEISHFGSKEDTFRFYEKSLSQSQGQEASFLHTALYMETARVLHDQNSRVLLALNKVSSSSMFCPSEKTSAQGTSQDSKVSTSNRFNGTRLFEECRSAIREMVLRNPLEFMYIKSEEKYLLRFVSHPLCPIKGSSDAEKVN